MASFNGDPMERVRHLNGIGATTAAIEQLENIKRQHPQAYRLNHLDFLRARLLTQTGKQQEANKLLGVLIRQDSHLQDLAFLMLLDNVDGTPLEKQRDYLESFLREFPDHHKWPEIAFRYATLLKRHQQSDEALTWYNRVWRLQRNPLSRKAALSHARMHLVKQTPSEAISDLTALIEINQKDDVALSAANDLYQLQPLPLSSESGIRIRTMVFMNNRQTKRTREYLAHLLEHYPESVSAPEYHYLQARTYAMDGHLSRALQSYREGYTRYPMSDWGIYCKYQAGNTALRLKNYTEAVQEYEELLKNHSNSRHAQKSYLNLADSQRWLGRDDLAEETVKRALNSADGPHQLEFRYYLARLYVEHSKYRSALRELQTLLTISSSNLPSRISGVTREEIFYLKGICHQSEKEPKLAKQAFTASAHGNPNYFSALSRLQLSPASKSYPVGSFSWEDRLIEPRSFLWKDPGSTAETRNSPLDKVRELLFLGLETEASVEIRRIGRKAFGNLNDYLFNLAYYSAIGNLPKQSLLAAETLQKSHFPGVSPNQLPTAIQRLIYPRHFWQLVKKAANGKNIDPYLLLAVIYQESRFDPTAKSSASARGLMQFMLGTARRLALEVDLPNLDASDLYRPEVSIHLGAHYLRKLINRHNDSSERALAAYNAGSGNVLRWLAVTDSTHDPSVFVSNIGFRETKLYVLKVLGNYYAYRSIYQPPQPGTTRHPNQQ
jgi:soluble lytic murein transglycosylase